MRIINAAPTSNTSDRATSVTTSTARVRLPPDGASSRPIPCFSASFGSDFDIRHAGATPARVPLTSAVAKAKARTVPSILMSARRGRLDPK